MPGDIWIAAGVILLFLSAVTAIAGGIFLYIEKKRMKYKLDAVYGSRN